MFIAVSTRDLMHPTARSQRRPRNNDGLLRVVSKRKPGTKIEQSIRYTQFLGTGENLYLTLIFHDGRVGGQVRV